jgi:hypothetical protein
LLKSGKPKSCGLSRLGAAFDAGTANKARYAEAKVASL